MEMEAPWEVTAGGETNLTEVGGVWEETERDGESEVGGEEETQTGSSERGPPCAPPRADS